MASNQAFVDIDPSGDLVVRCYMYVAGATFQGALGATIEGRILGSYRVSRQILIKNSKYYSACLTGKFAETGLKVIDEQVDNNASCAAVQICFRALHDNQSSEITKNTSINDVWKVVLYCDYREIGFELMFSWFAAWFAIKGPSKLSHSLEWQEEERNLRMLLFPSYIFDHAKCFAAVTKRLVYNSSGHITEINPTKNRTLHLDGNVIGAMNGARGSLRSKLLRGCFDPVSSFLKQSCACKEKSLFSYNMALSKTGLWPIHDQHKKSILDIINSPGFINFKCEIADGTCNICKLRLLSTDISSILRTELISYFNGLCLDCMKLTKTGDVHQDYWEHDIHQEWGTYCRVSHEQPTWYFSFMGRKTDMMRHKEAKRRHAEMRDDFY